MEIRCSLVFLFFFLPTEVLLFSPLSTLRYLFKQPPRQQKIQIQNLIKQIKSPLTTPFNFTSPQRLPITPYPTPDNNLPPSILINPSSSQSLDLSNPRVIPTSPNLKAQNSIQRLINSSKNQQKNKITYHIIFQTTDPSGGQPSQSSIEKSDIQEIIQILEQQLNQNQNQQAPNNKLKPITIIKQYSNNLGSGNQPN